NTNQGYRYQLTAQLSKQYKFGLNFMAAYTYGQSKDIANGIRNSPESNWQLNQATNANNPQLTYSNFDVRHRIVATVGYKKSWNERFTSYLSLIFTGQSGSPYTWDITANNKLTNSGQQVDVFYIPQNQSDINLVQYTDANGVVHTPQQQWNDLNNYINNDKYLSTHRGQYTERNAARTPWLNQLDMRFMQDIVIKGRNKIQITFDIINLTNLINPSWGWQYFVPNTLNSSASIGLTPLGTTTNGNPNFNFSAPTTSPYSVDKIASRWQGQIGVRYLF
ncbi:MAG TPA: TonB-dependent receptor, partial [Bacteroidia bacterium]